MDSANNLAEAISIPTNNLSWSGTYFVYNRVTKRGDIEKAAGTGKQKCGFAATIAAGVRRNEAVHFTGCRPELLEI